MNILIIGCGRVGSELAELLDKRGHDVSVIDRRPENFDRLPGDFSGFTTTGVPIDQNVLRKAGIESCDAVCAVTQDDDLNIMAAQMAKEIFGVQRVFARISDVDKVDVFKGFGIHTVCPTRLTVLSACVKAGAQPAAPGEFTKRALLNGKLSLTQAEAVADIISAQGDQLLNCANGQREGALYRRMEKCADSIMEVSSQISAWIDYPDDDTPVVTQEWLCEKLSAVRGMFADLLSGYDTGRMLREGISCAIVGKPNAGKSTLMNSLAGQQRSIVSDIEGTTRDIVEETIALGDIVLRVADCAGIRDTDDAVEKIGVDIMLKKLENADIVLAVFDGSRELSGEDRRLLELLDPSKTVAVVNKSDLPQKLELNEISAKLGAPAVISAKSGENSGEPAKLLEKAVSEKLDLGRLDPDAGFLANERQRDCIIRADRALSSALEAAQLGVTPDAVGVMLEEALDAVYELSGKRAGDEVIDEVFRRFCVGK